MTENSSTWQFVIADSLEKVFADVDPRPMNPAIGFSVFLGETASFQIADIRRAGSSATNVLSVAVEQDRAYRIEFSDASLTNRPMVWSSFQSNGTWTNRTPYTNLHEFADDGTAGSSGAPLGTSRTYRVWVGLP